jgi:hypothetical protein
MSVNRQFGVHEIPGTEEPAPTRRPETVSAGFELQMRTYVNAIWVKLAELEGKIEDFEGWRTDIALALKDATGIDPRSSQGRPMLVTDDGGVAKGKRAGASPKPPVAKPWAVEGVSKATWYRRHKEGAP